jgi:peptide/nickel transport system substrate-binding protein
MKHFARSIAIAILSLVVLSASAFAATGAAKPSGKLTAAVGTFAFETFLPGEGSIAGEVYWDPIYDYMFYEDDHGSIVPGLITNWKLSDDHRAWTLTVRQGVKWHNGRELDAKDIAFNFDYWITSPKSTHNTTSVIGQNIESVKVTGKYSLEVTLKKPQALFLNWLSWAVSAPVVPREYGTMDPSQAREHPIGTGAWKFVSRRIGENVKFEAVGEHWLHVPAFKELELKLVPEPSTRLAMLKNGEADIIDLPLSFKREVSGLPFKIIRATDSFSTFIFFGGMYNDPKAPAYDPNLPTRKLEVREALNLAIDRQAIADHVFQGEARPEVVPMPLPTQLGYKSEWKPYPYDPSKAKQLLIEAGYPDGFDIQLMSYPRPGIPDVPLMIEAIADYWSRIGVKVKIVKTEWGAIRPVVRARKAKFAAPDSQGLAPPDVIAFVFGDPFYEFNISSKVDAAVDRVKAAATREEMATALEQLANATIEEYGVVPMDLVNQVYVVNPKTVGGWPVKAHQGGLNRLSYVSKP